MARFQALTNNVLDAELEMLRKHLGLEPSQKADLLREISDLAAWVVRQAEQGREIEARKGEFVEPLVHPALERVRFHEPSAPFMSTVTARFEPAQRLGTLLVDQLTAPVKFTQAASELAREGVRTFVEVGPGNVLSGLVKRIDRSVKAVSVNSLAALEKLEETLSTA